MNNVALQRALLGEQLAAEDELVAPSATLRPLNLATIPRHARGVESLLSSIEFHGGGRSTTGAPFEEEHLSLVDTLLDTHPDAFHARDDDGTPYYSHTDGRVQWDRPSLETERLAAEARAAERHPGAGACVSCGASSAGVGGG